MQQPHGVSIFARCQTLGYGGGTPTILLPPPRLYCETPKIGGYLPHFWWGFLEHTALICPPRLVEASLCPMNDRLKAQINP